MPKSPLASQSPQAALESKMHELELTSKEREAETRARGLGVQYINLQGFPVSPEALELVPEERAASAGAICFFFSGTEIRVGATDPSREDTKQLLFELQERHKAHGALYLISEESLRLVLKLYAALPKIKPIVKGVEISEAEITKYEAEVKNFKDLQAKITAVPITDVLTLVISAGLQARTSDIHIEAEETDVKVRFRVDGALVDVAALAHELWPRIISRIKLISSLKINVTDKPQDGRFTIFYSPTSERNPELAPRLPSEAGKQRAERSYKKEKVDVRVSTIPTAYGESVVMRILRQAAVALEFDGLGLRGKAAEELRREVDRPNGMIITTGPTGSGKTTTLYAILKKLNTPDVKIITLEDPVEYKLQGINQSQINPSKEYTFAKGLRSILRQDPDVVMVGEIRDLETAEIAIQAALTGHLVLSTIHTNNAAGAIPRFLSMGTKPFLLAPALNAVIGQRLVRRIHEDCKVEDQPSPEELERVKQLLGALPSDSGYTIDLANMKFWKGKGCAGCNDIGFKGRVGIYEIFTMNAEIEKVILSGAISQYDMEALAQKHGMITMVQDGLLKALDGMTTVGEVFAVAE